MGGDALLTHELKRFGLFGFGINIIHHVLARVCTYTENGILRERTLVV